MTKSFVTAAAAMLVGAFVFVVRPVVATGGGPVSIVGRHRAGGGRRGGARGGREERGLLLSPQDVSPPQEQQGEEGQEKEEDRILRRKKGKSKTPQNCCDVVKRIMELDKACKSVVVSVETAIVCEEDFNTVVSTGKGSSLSNSSARRLAAAVLAFDSFVTSFQNREFAVTQDSCFPDTAEPISLATFGDWCSSATINVDGTLSYAPEGPIEDLGDYILNY